MNKLIVLLIFFSVSLSASTPSVEGLFRHPSNGDVSMDTVLFNFSIKKDFSKDQLPEPSPNGVDETPVTEYFVKYIFDLTPKNQVKVLKVYYSNKKMKDEDIVNVRYYDSLSSTGFKKDQLFFNALLSSLVLNRSEEMIKYLKNISKDIKKNKEVLDWEKLSLLNKYKGYLKSKKDSPDDDLVNPLRPGSPDDTERVSAILRKPLLMNSDSITLIRKGERFEWNLTLDSILGVFENESLRMKKLEVQNVSTIDQVLLDNFILVDGIHDFPKYFKVSLGGDNYVLNLIRMYHFNSSRSSIRDRYKEYNKKIRKNNIITKNVSFPLI